MVAVITSTAPGNLGFNPFSAIKSVAKTAARVATNPNVQRAATAAAGSYAPAQYTQALQYAAKAKSVYRTVVGPDGHPVQVPAQPVEAAMPDGAPEHVGKKGPGMITLAAIGGGLLLVLLLTRR